MSPATLCRLMAGCVPCKLAGHFDQAQHGRKEATSRSRHRCAGPNAAPASPEFPVFSQKRNRELAQDRHHYTVLDKLE